MRHYWWNTVAGSNVRVHCRRGPHFEARGDRMKRLMWAVGVAHWINIVTLREPDRSNNRRQIAEKISWLFRIEYRSNNVPDEVELDLFISNYPPKRKLGNYLHLGSALRGAAPESFRCAENSDYFFSPIFSTHLIIRTADYPAKRGPLFLILVLEVKNS